jgi:ABC-type phosphate/phosphonate transport system substrate-binding protein
MHLDRHLFLFGLVVSVLIAVAGQTKVLAQEKPAKVSLVESVFSGQSREKVVQQIRPFAEIVEKETNRQAIFDVFSFAQAEKDFDKGDADLVIATGLEYGWLRARNPNAKALVVASIDPGATKTVIIAKQTDSAAKLADVSGKKLALPDRVPFLCTFYLERTLGKKLDSAFTLVKLDNVDDTIEAVIDGKADAAVVTAANLDTYKERKPGRFQRLKIVNESPEFPPATVMYNAKTAEAGALERFEKALLRAGESAEGNRVLTLFKLKGFEKIPPNYDERLAEIVKQFPEEKK